MATYAEITNLINDSTLRQKVTVACIVAAENIRTEAVDFPNHVNRLAWARTVYDAPSVMANRMMPSIIVQNKAITAAQITAASDAAIQAAVDGAVAAFVG